MKTETDMNAPAVQIIADLAKGAAGASVLAVPTKGLGEGLPQEIPVLFDHRSQGTGLQSLQTELERYRLVPQRRKGTAKTSTLASFIHLTKRHQDDSSALFARTEWPEPALTAVINYHETEGAPRHGDHRVEYRFPVTEEFSAWIDQDGTPFDQASFAAFVEEHAAELASPFDGEVSEYEQLFHVKFATPSEMVALSRGLQVHVAAQVKNAVTLNSGEAEVVFVEEHLDAKGDKVTVPGLFMVSVPAFIDGEPVRIPARLRYRMREGKLIWFYQLYRWRFWLRERVQGDLATAAKDTGLPAFQGAPEH